MDTLLLQILCDSGNVNRSPEERALIEPFQRYHTRAIEIVNNYNLIQSAKQEEFNTLQVDVGIAHGHLRADTPAGAFYRQLRNALIEIHA